MIENVKLLLLIVGWFAMRFYPVTGALGVVVWLLSLTMG